VIVVVAGPQSDWDVAYALERELPDGYRVEPALPTAFGSPDPDEAAAIELELAEAPAPPFGWALDQIRARAAWEASGARGRGIVVGHPDTGYRLHAELVAEMFDLERDRDVIDEDDDALDPLEQGTFPEFLQPGHGSRTSSVIAGRSEGVLSGAAPEATVVPIRTVRSVIQIVDADVAKAVDYARRSGCHVISMSLGGFGFRGLEAAINRAVREGMIVLAAAGNSVPFRIVVWPARYRNCLAIAASNASELAWSQSSRGGKIAVSAPGEAVWVPHLGSTADPPVTTSSGTSFAVAHVAGAAAVWLSLHGHAALKQRYGAAQIQQVFVHSLERSSRRVPGLPSGKFGAGIVDLHALVELDLPEPTEVAAFEELVEPTALTSRREQLSELFPDVDEATALRRLAAALELSEADAVALVERYPGELLRLVGEDRTLHERLGDPGDLEVVAQAPAISGQRLSLQLAAEVAARRSGVEP
jgi:subtilisin family serine protease